MKTKEIAINWMIRRNYPDVLRIERAVFNEPWTEVDLVGTLRLSNCTGMVLEYDRKVCGFMVYELHQKHLNFLNFAVHPQFQRRGFGTMMVDRIKEKLHQQRRTRVEIVVRETNLSAQLFFSNNNFVAVDTLNNFYERSHDQAYVFRYQIGGKARRIVRPSIPPHLLAEQNNQSPYLNPDPDDEDDERWQ